jgi:transposase
MSLVLERSRRKPLFFEIYGGSIPDVVTLKRTVQSIKDTIPQDRDNFGEGIFFP